MALYDEMQSLASELLSNPDFKQGSTQLVVVTPGNWPIDEPGPESETFHNLDGAVRGVKFTYVANGLAVASDLQITHAVIPGVVPSMRDFVIVDGIRYKIVSVLPKPAAGTVVAYTLIIRR